eukprot:gene4405-biopygen2453
MDSLIHLVYINIRKPNCQNSQDILKGNIDVVTAELYRAEQGANRSDVMSHAFLIREFGIPRKVVMQDA